MFYNLIFAAAFILHMAILFFGELTEMKEIYHLLAVLIISVGLFIIDKLDTILQKLP